MPSFGGAAHQPCLGGPSSKGQALHQTQGETGGLYSIGDQQGFRLETVLSFKGRVKQNVQALVLFCLVLSFTVCTLYNYLRLSTYEH